MASSSSRTQFSDQYKLIHVSKSESVDDGIENVRRKIQKRIGRGPPSVDMESLEDIPKRNMGLLQTSMNLLTVKDKMNGWMTNLRDNLPRLVEAREHNPVIDHGIEGPCLVAGGSNPDTPLIKKQFKTLRQNDLPPNMKVPVVACDRAFSLIAKIRTPEYTVILENNRDPNYDFLFGDGRRKYTKDSTLFASIITHPDIVAAWKGPVYFFRHEFPLEAVNFTATLDFLFEPLPSLWHGGNVGMCSYMVAAFLRGNPIGLVGMDFGMKTGHVDAKRGPQYITGPVLMAYAQAFAEAIRQLEALGVRTVNCTEGGILRAPWIERMTLENYFAEVIASKTKTPIPT